MFKRFTTGCNNEVREFHMKKNHEHMYKVYDLWEFLGIDKLQQ